MGGIFKEMKDLDLIVPVDEIPDGGYVIEGTLPPEWVGDSALEAYTALTPVRVSLLAKRFTANVHVSGSLSLRLGFQCSRTLAPGEIDLELSLSELFQPAGKHDLNLGDGLDADAIEDEPYTFESNKIDLEPFLREELVLAQDPYPTLAPREGLSDAGPVWQSGQGEVDARWAKLKDLEL